MEMPYSLQTLPPEAIDILRFYATIDVDSAYADAIVDGANMSERGFGKGIRRLVTKNYLVMSSDQIYRLTDAGKRVIEEMRQYDADDTRTDSSREDEDAPDTSEKQDARFVRRHLVLVAPRTLPANQRVQVMVGFEQAADSEGLEAPVHMLLRIGVVNGEAQRPNDANFALANRPVQQTFEISAGAYKTARLRIEACQYQDDLDDFEFCGGMYVDLPVSADSADSSAAAYGVDVILKED